MRLIQATIRSYRSHGSTDLTFDPRRTVIGGPNETGKSTLAEALHRVLFLKSKGNTGDHRGMTSTTHPGPAEVRLDFETGGTRWSLRKIFGPGGSAALTPEGGLTLTGEAAESELARLLGVEAGLTGKAVVGQWSHLWVWQHEAALDPSGAANDHKDQLLQRLQTLGGAAALQSERDSRVAAAIAAQHETTRTAAGKAKAHSELARSETALEEALAAEAAARERASGLEAAVRTCGEAESDLLRFARDLDSLREQMTAASRQRLVIEEHRSAEAERARAQQAAAERCDALERNEAALTSLRGELAALEAELAPLEESCGELTGNAMEAQAAATGAAREFELAGETVNSARRRHDLETAWQQGILTDSALREITGRVGQAEIHQRSLAALRHELDSLPPLDGARLARLEKLSSALESARSSLAAMAAGLEILTADGPVKLGGEALAAGDSRILTEPSELCLGETWRVRIRPGGGAGLTEAREALRQAGEALRAALAESSVENLAEAAKVAARHASLIERRRADELALASLQAATLTEALTRAQSAATAAGAETARRAVVLPEVPPPATAEEARSRVEESGRRLAEAETAAARCKTSRDAAEQSASGAASALRSREESLAGLRNRQTVLRARLDYVLETQGDDDARQAALNTARQDREAAAAALAAVRGILESLQPDHNARTLDRLRRGLDGLTEQRTAAETRLAVASAQLRSDGSSDPGATLALASAKVAAARETRDRLTRRADAVALLHRLFQSEQQALAERFTGPLADRISGYLECIFGPGARVAVQYENQEFTGLRLHRPDHPGGAFDFARLSGGTREQTAAAVRLAMAEVLAGPHGGTLPVLFDDAFTNSDPVRLRQLQSMLDLAAERGLQVILLTCTPADYTALGAREIRLGDNGSAQSSADGAFGGSAKPGGAVPE